MLDELISSRRFLSPLIIEGSARLRKARGYAQAALCVSENACGECSSCKKFVKGLHPDFLAMPENPKMEDIRQGLLMLRQMPFESKRRVFLVPEVGSHQFAVQNALLKTLEEPSPHWVLLLTVESKWALLETIRSRCLQTHVSDTQTVALTEDEMKLFSAIQNQDDLEAFSWVEDALKERKASERCFRHLLMYASEHLYPGFWRFFGPALDQTLEQLPRNLNQKILWDRAWTQALDEAAAT